MTSRYLQIKLDRAILKEKNNGKIVDRLFNSQPKHSDDFAEWIVVFRQLSSKPSAAADSFLFGGRSESNIDDA